MANKNIDCLIGFTFVRIQIGDVFGDIDDLMDLDGGSVEDWFEDVPPVDPPDSNSVLSAPSGDCCAVREGIAIVDFNLMPSLGGLKCSGVEYEIECDGISGVLSALDLSGYEWLVRRILKETSEDAVESLCVSGVVGRVTPVDTECYVVLALDYHSYGPDRDSEYESEFGVVGWMDFARGCVVWGGNES